MIAGRMGIMSLEFLAGNEEGLKLQAAFPLISHQPDPNQLFSPGCHVFTILGEKSRCSIANGTAGGDVSKPKNNAWIGVSIHAPAWGATVLL